jgi:tRNA-intron endonuclease
VQRSIKGELAGDHVIIPDQKSASRLINRGQFGTPQSGGSLSLDLIEAFYLLDSNKLQISKSGNYLSPEEFLTFITKAEPTFEIKYIVYRDLRSRGHIVKPSNVTDFVVYEPSDNTKRARSRKVRYWSLAVSERARFNISNLSELIVTAKNTRKDLLICLVDEEGDLTYYSAKLARPKGKLKPRKLKTNQKSSAWLVEDRVMLWDPDVIADLRKVGFYGKEVGSSLQLALTESAYLMTIGILEIKLARTRRKVSQQQYMRIARKLQPDFDRRLAVYRELKSHNLIVKTGFKYGTHFRVYAGDPEHDHSELLVHGVPMNYECSWEEISRAVRLAQGVRKQMLFGRVLDDGEHVEYINIGRIKP